jgi:hypothetical protein
MEEGVEEAGKGIGKGNQNSTPEALQPHYVVSTNGHHLLYHHGRRSGAPSFSVLQAGSSGEQQESFLSR